MSAVNEQIWQVLRQVYGEHNERHDAVVVDGVAAETLRRIDPEGLAATPVHYLSLQQLKQMARHLCRHFHITREQAEAAARQCEIFSDRLQDRYPVVRDGREMYVKRQLLTLAERTRLSRALRRIAAGLEEHARALDTETHELVSSGLLDGTA